MEGRKRNKNRQPFDESLLMAIATLGAIGVALARSGDYTEAIAVMLFLPGRRVVPKLCGGTES